MPALSSRRTRDREGSHGARVDRVARLRVDLGEVVSRPGGRGSAPSEGDRVRRNRRVERRVGRVVLVHEAHGRAEQPRPVPTLTAQRAERGLEGRNLLVRTAEDARHQILRAPVRGYPRVVPAVGVRRRCTDRGIHRTRLVDQDPVQAVAEPERAPAVAREEPEDPAARRRDLVLLIAESVAARVRASLLGQQQRATQGRVAARAVSLRGRALVARAGHLVQQLVHARAEHAGSVESVSHRDVAGVPAVRSVNPGNVGDATGPSGRARHSDQRDHSHGKKRDERARSSRNALHPFPPLGNLWTATAAAQVVLYSPARRGSRGG